MRFMFALDERGNGIGRCSICLKVRRLSGGVCDNCQEYH